METFHDAGVRGVLNPGSGGKKHDLEFDVLLWYFRPFPVHVGRWRPRLSRVHVALWGACVLGAFSRGAFVVYLLTVFELVVAPPGCSVLLTERSGFFPGLVLVSPSVSVFSRVLLRAFGSWLLVVLSAGGFHRRGCSASSFTFEPASRRSFSSSRSMARTS